jgi:hypothetical protein
MTGRAMSLRGLGRPVMTVLGLALWAGTGVADTRPVRVELPAGVPSLAVMRTSSVLVRIVNHSADTIPGCTVADYDRGQLCTFLGAWFADERPPWLSTFQHTLRLERAIPPGSADFSSIEVKPEKTGKVFLGVGLYLGSRSGVGSGQLGQIAAPRVYVARGSWFDEHRRLLLRVLVGAHVGGTLLSAALLVAWTMRR